MKILITEHKSVGALAPASLKRSVRVFVNFDMNYGYFVSEHLVFQELSKEQQALYLAEPSSVELDLEPAAVQRLIDAGVTPYKKEKVA